MPSHVVAGFVEKVYKTQSTKGNRTTTDCVAEIVVTDVAEGNHIAAKDRIFVKYRYRNWIDKTPFNEPKLDGEQGHKVGAMVTVYLKGNRWDGFTVCEPNGYLICKPKPAKHAGLIPAGINSLPDHPFERNENFASLIITTSVGMGDNFIKYEFTRINKTITANIHHSYNHHVGHDSRSGSLSSIIEAATGSKPETLENYQTLDSILPVMKQNGWNVIDSTTHEDSTVGPLGGTVRTLNFLRKNAGQHNDEP